MSYNAQFPQWIIDSSIANQQLGQQMGRNMLEGLKFQEQKRQYEEEKAAKQPLLDAQIQLNQANAISQSIQNQQQIAAFNRQNEAQAAMTDAVKLESGINRSEGSWTSPENKAAVSAFLERNPSLYGSSWHQNMLKQFDNAEKAKRQTELEAQKIEGRKEVAQLRYDKSNANEASFEDFNNLLGQYNDPVVALDVMHQNSSGPYSGKVKMNAQALRAQIAALKNSGVSVDNNEALDAWNRYMVGGGAITSDKDEAKNIKSESKSYELLSQASQQIDNFNKKYGENAFDEYVGPIDNWSLKYKNMLMNSKNVPQQAKDANEVFQKVNQIIQGYRRGQFGTALSRSESDLFKGIISDPSYSNYAESLRNFRDNLGDSLKESVKQYKLSPNIPLEIKRRWAASEPPVNPQYGTTSPLSSGNEDVMSGTGQYASPIGGGTNSVPGYPGYTFEVLNPQR